MRFQFFWSVLENFDDRQRQRFVKFACNQDRIPIPADESRWRPYDHRIYIQLGFVKG
jgi:hypothetical protein